MYIMTYFLNSYKQDIAIIIYSGISIIIIYQHYDLF